MKAGDILEIAGQVVGRIEEVTEDTLLVRKGYLTYSDGQEVMVLTKQAVYLDSETIKNEYWIKTMDLTIVPIPFNIKGGRNLIIEFLNV
ncbi:hypothetical protein VV27_13470 [Listeria monocytogenes]|uniref:Uncharacterized protein n=1 Tax=Listeria seeligeri TaxID=1640 RepID=A0A7X0X1U0_LISSE|nr:hypothetical protein [Listeria seeligeri]EAC4365868.1 hypothetical protein [Listeria monocytogenes]EAC8843132.1 hypothetical protein [Listeria monocytogenes]EAD0271815.1 hypothetical protein [Listeria monocytogenes]EAD4555694.1 hypothetical protein [Listeria monocytogenes]EAE9170064.1 hypothetical protein [Listeria monocytogenes]